MGPDQVDVLAARARSTPDRIALIDAASGRSVTFGELDRWAETLARALTAELDEQPRIGTLLSPSPAFTALFHAVVRMGGTLVSLNTRLAADELATQLSRADPDLIVSERATGDLANRAEERRQNGKRTPIMSVETLPTAEANNVPDSDDWPSRNPEETVLVLFTSGSTGEPKGVRLTGRNLTASATASAYRLGVSPGDRWLGVLPVYHMGGLAPVVRTACYGTTLVTLDGFDASEVLAAVADHDVTGVSLVPTQLSRLLEETTGAGRLETLAALETVLLGGAPASAKLFEQAREAGVPVFPTYGLTETASQVATARPEQTEDHPETVGQPLFGTRVRILSDGEPVGPGGRGEIVVDGPTVTPGYLDGDGEAFGPFGFHTGDVGYRDEAGRLWVEGRKDEQILTGGELVAPQEVAERLETHPDVADAAVVGLEDDQWGERVVALVVTEDGERTGEGSVAGHETGAGIDEAMQAALREYCRERLADYKVPKTVALTDSLPRTPSGTLDRPAIRERIRNVE